MVAPRRLGILIAVLVLVAACGGPGPTATPGPASSATPGAITPSPGERSTPSVEPSTGPSAEPSAPAGPVDVPLALVADIRERRTGLSADRVRADLEAGAIVIPCGIEGVSLGGKAVGLPSTECQDADKIGTWVRAKAGRFGLVPPGLVNPRIKVLRVGAADLFGGPKRRASDYPLVARADGWPASWTAYDPNEVRTLISLGDSCPDRGVSNQTNTLGKGWDWALNGGTAKYTGRHWDSRFDWWVVDAKRTGNEGAVTALISDAEITLDDFECPMTKHFVQHDTGTVFSIDPKVAPLLARHGIDIVTLASNHLTDQGTGALRETLALFDKNKIKRFGAGMNLAEALKPAVIDVRGVRFGFVGFNEIPGSAKAGAGTPGVAYLTSSNVKKGVAAARKVAEVVIVVPQWGWPEYHANFTARQKNQMDLFFEAGADHVIGHGTHWAAAVAIRPGEEGDHFVISSHGNFLFGQDWSRQTQEGVIVELTFVGTRLAQARLHPYIMLDQAQANLVDPATDGKFVLDQVWSNSKLPK